MRVEWVADGVRHVSDDGGTRAPRKKKSVSDDEADKKPWLEYRPGKGYFWGPGHPRAGEPAHFGVD